jgi:hypothetical protein
LFQDPWPATGPAGAATGEKSRTKFRNIPFEQIAIVLLRKQEPRTAGASPGFLGLQLSPEYERLQVLVQDEGGSLIHPKPIVLDTFRRL